MVVRTYGATGTASLGREWYIATPSSASRQQTASLPAYLSTTSRLPTVVEQAFVKFRQVKAVYRRRSFDLLEYYVVGEFGDWESENRFYDKEAELLQLAPAGSLSIVLLNLCSYENQARWTPPDGFDFVQIELQIP